MDSILNGYEGLHGDIIFMEDRISELIDSLNGNESKEMLCQLIHQTIDEITSQTDILQVMGRNDIEQDIVDRIKQSSIKYNYDV